MEDLSAWILFVLLMLGLVFGWCIYRRAHPAVGKWSWKQFFLLCGAVTIIVVFQVNAERWFPRLDDGELNLIRFLLI